MGPLTCPEKYNAQWACEGGIAAGLVLGCKQHADEWDIFSWLQHGVVIGGSKESSNNGV